ncbi:MAG: class II fructose-bisphosphate aldolase [Planctomycetes bacterium]|nr:class II fructose-bisphosphate aldolase [Planctomycetota bacterium]
MRFVPTAVLVREAFEQGYAVPSFCIWNAETAATLLAVASDCRAPVILMCGPGEFPVLPAAMMAEAARLALAHRPARAALHLDHGDSVDLVRECLAAGFTGVMLDYSVRPLAENTAALREMAALAGPAGASVEGELGAVGRVDDVTVEGGHTSALTDPQEARRYVEATGVDMLAVSIGNAHGIYAARPQLDFARLEAIRAAVGVPLVLHGGSGTPEEDLRKAVALGIAKVNVASELVRAVRESLRGHWDAGDRSWLPVQVGRAMAALAPVAERWIRACGAAGRA